MKHYILLARPYQWSKNLFIVAPAFFGFSEFAFDRAFLLAICLVAFCLLSSGIYVINDIIDVKADRLHPLKRFRPIAAGKVRISNAFIFAFVLAALAFLLLFFLSSWGGAKSII